MKNAIVKLGFCLIFLCAGYQALAANPTTTVTRITSSPTNAASIEFDVLFSEDVSGFTGADVTLSGAGAAGASAAVASISASASHYKITVTGHTTNGPINVDIGPGVANAVAAPSDPNLASTQITTIFDNVKPGITFTHPGQADPTTGALTIKYTVTFSESITGFTAGTISFTGSGAGLGTLTVGPITEIAPMNQTKYEVIVNVPGTATGNLHALISIAAGAGITDAAGNTNNASTGGDNDVTYAGTFPTMAKPTAVATSTNFTISSNVLTDGGRPVTERGTAWNTTPPVGPTDNDNNQGSGLGTFDHTRSTSVVPHARYYFVTYADNALGRTLSEKSFVWTLDDDPGMNGNLSTAAATSGSTIDLTFTAYGTNADGLAILRLNGGTGVASSALLQGQKPEDQPGFVTKINSSSQTTFTDTGLSGSQQYTYVTVPYNVFGTQDSTTHYKTTYNSKSATTFSALSRIIENATPASTLAYETRQASSITLAAHGLSIADLHLVDGNSPADDGDTDNTELATLTIHVDNFQYINRIAILDNTEILAEGQLDASGNIMFPIAAGKLLANDNDDAGDQFNIIASFKPVVDDGAVIKVTITGATVTNSSSGLVNPAAGGYNTGPTRNAIAVVATKFVITGQTPIINPTPATWGFTATLKDNLDNIDTNIGGDLELSEASLTGDLDNPINSGVAVFTNLAFGSAGSKSVILDATNWPGANNGTLLIDAESLGVTPAGPTATFCFNNTSATLSSFALLGAISLPESDATDFKVGSGQTFTLKLPDGFIFDVTAAPTLTDAGSPDVTNTTQDPILANLYIGDNIVRLKYSVGGTATKDVLTINGLKVKYTGTVAVSNQEILRIGGSAVQEGNADTDQNPHGLLSASDGSIPVQFENIAGASATQTSFAKSSGAITLQGKNDSNDAVLTGANAIFSGDGVAFDGTDYKFNPSTVATGDHDITFTYTDPAGQTVNATPGVTGCISNITKTYNVFQSLIVGLSTSYCYNDPPSNLGNPTTPAPVGPTCLSLLGLSVPIYANGNYRYEYLRTTALFPSLVRTWTSFPNQTQFSPSDPAFAIEVLFFGTVEIRAWYVANPNCLFPAGDIFIGSASIRVNNPPFIDIRNNFASGICSTTGEVPLVGDFYTPSNGFDEFWSTESGLATPAPGVTGDRVTNFKLNPVIANAGSSDVLIDIHYRHKDGPTGCISEVVRPVSVWGKPTTVAPSDVRAKVFFPSPGIAGMLDPEFCLTETRTPFTVTTVPGVVHSWKVQGVARISEGDGFSIFDTDFPGGIVANGEANYKLTQVTHRDLSTGFIGCESNALDLSVTLKRPTFVIMDKNGQVCEGNPLLLSTVHHSFDTPDAGLDGTWSSTSTVKGKFLDIDGDEVFNFLDALTYEPSDEEYAATEFILVLKTAEPSGPCGPDQKEVLVKVSPGADITFPDSPIIRCAGPSISVITEVTNNAPFTWSETGDGGFDVTSIKQGKATFIPSANQLDHGGTVTLTVTTDDPDGPGPCDVVIQPVTLIINQQPLINAGVDLEVCTDEAQAMTFDLHAIQPPTLSSADSWTWSVLSSDSGPNVGAIDDPTALITTYHPSNVPQSNPNFLDYDNFGTITAPRSKMIIFIIEAAAPVGNVCPNVTDEVTVTIHGRPKPPVFTQPNPYCVNETVSLLKTTVINPAWYTNIGGSNPVPVLEGDTFGTGVIADHEQQVTFWLTQTFDERQGLFDGCESDFTPITIIVNPLPTATFTFENQCFGETMHFTSQATIAQPVVGTRTIASYEWIFDDGTTTDPGSGNIPIGVFKGTSGVFNAPDHKFEDVGKYNVRMNVVSSDGCPASKTENDIEVGSIPVANFTVDKQCKEDATKFTSTSGLPGGDPIPTYGWDFGDATSGSNQSTLASPTHVFTAVNTYPVTLTITTALGCSDVFTRNTSIFPYVKTFPYIEDFESANHGWVPEGSVTTGVTVTNESSWNLLNAAGDIVSDPNEAAGSRFWATHANVKPDVFYYDNERSLLYGPCVDMTTLSRPVLAMDFFSDLESKSDGVYLEYIDENAASPQWTRLGDNASGLNWYNESSISGLARLSGIGQDISQFGWSGTTTGWTTSRFNLDPFANKTRLRFRVVFGSNTSPLLPDDLLDGFALDYFRLETRNRLVLVENFTSKSSSTAVTNNTNKFKEFPTVDASSEVVKIEYHTGLPVSTGDPADPIFSQNPMDPNARASFYGLSAVPRGYIDGYTNLTGNGMFSGSWALPYYNTESLKTSPIDIVIDNPTITDGIINVKGTIKANDIALLANKYSLYIAVVEKEVGNDAFVLRKMLPSASGRKVPVTARGSSFTFDESWSVDKSLLGEDPELVAVAFVQSDIVVDPSTGERPVLQAAYNDNVPTVTYTTGIEIPFLEQTAMYPNPADRLVTIELPQATDSGVDVRIFDQLGRAVSQSTIGVGHRSTTLDTSNMAGAMYIVQLNERGVNTTKKLIITHKH